VDPDTCHTGVYFDMDAWQCIEYYVKISTDPNVARWRIWKNGILIREMPRDEQHKYKTLLDSNHCYMSTFIMSNWNGCVPLTQTQFVDDIIVTSDPNYPFKYDAQGNPMIGPIGWVNPGDEPVYTGTATLTLTPSTIVQHSPDPVIMTAVFENTSDIEGDFELSVDIYKNGNKIKEDFKKTTAEVAANSSITRNVAFLASAAAGDYLFVLEVKPVGQPDVIVVSAEALLTLINP
jgi:hypothetical protein